MKILVDSVVVFPKALLKVREITEELTVSVRKQGARIPEYVRAYEEDDKYLYLPRDYGLQLIAKLGHTPKYRVAKGKPVEFPHHVTHTGAYAYQAQVVEDMLKVSELRNDFLVEAATGKGKTVMALSVAQKRGVATLVVVDQENLLTQWIDRCKTTLHLSDEQIGRVQGSTCLYEGKVVTIAMLQSLVQREYPEEMYSHFGTVIFDEVHGVGAPLFSTALRLFPAEVRFGVSATIERPDALQRILHWNLGNVEVSLTDTHDKSYLYYLEYGGVYSWYANISPKSGRILMEVSEDTNRNALIVEAIDWLYREGREVLIIGDRIEQLEALMAMAHYAGIPKAAMGLHTGMRSVWAYAKTATPTEVPYGYVEGTDYTPVGLEVSRKRVPKAVLEGVGKNATLVFATYHTFSKGVDVPRLTAGIDCTPRAKAKQTHGRILRVSEGKLVPIWVTLRDVNSYRLEYQFLQRLVDYVEDSAEVYKWRIGKGVRLADVTELKRQVRQRVAHLKKMEIVTLEDKSCMLQTPSTLTEQKSQHGRPTAKSTPYRKAR